MGINTANSAVIEDDNADIGVRVGNSNCELYAFIDIPLGYTATKVKINGSDATNDVQVFTYDIDDGTITSEISNTGLDVGDDLALATNHVGADDTLLMIKIDMNNSDRVYGGYVTIQPS